MRSVFTTFVSSRYIDRDAVLQELKRCAHRLKRQRPEVRAVYLFGSFATGEATPRSDADILVEILAGGAELREEIWLAATGAFLDAPVPVDLFVLPSAALEEGRRSRQGVAARVAAEGIRLDT